MSRAFVAALTCIILAACGGGGASTPVPVPQPRGPFLAKQVVYFGGCVTSIPELAGQVNTWWATGWCGPTRTWHVDIVSELQSARANGFDYVVIQIPDAMWANATETAFQLGRIDASGVLAGFAGIDVAALDEPNNADTDHGAKTDAEVTAKNLELRALFARLPTFNSAKVMNLYACSKPGRPGITTSDTIGCDAYDPGPGVTAAWDDLYNAMSPTQTFMTVVGGSSPWKADPTWAITWASNHPRVRLHVWFRHEDTAQKEGPTLQGIHNNGMARAYCVASWDVLHHNEPAMCQ